MRRESVASLGAVAPAALPGTHHGPGSEQVYVYVSAPRMDGTGWGRVSGPLPPFRDLSPWTQQGPPCLQASWGWGRRQLGPE